MPVQGLLTHGIPFLTLILGRRLGRDTRRVARFEAGQVGSLLPGHVARQLLRISVAE